MIVRSIQRNGRPGAGADRPGRPGGPPDTERGPRPEGRPDGIRGPGDGPGRGAGGDFARGGRPDVIRQDPSRRIGIDHGPSRYDQLRDRLRDGDLRSITHSRAASRLHLERQYRHRDSGDIARRLGLHDRFRGHNDWHRNRHYGSISRNYVSLHFGHRYWGPGYYPSRVWWPHWTDWVRWSWWDHCLPVYDPRPIYCRPYIYDPCPPLVIYDYPQWQPLYTAHSGTWVDVPSVTVAPQTFDVQLLAVRFVDAGHPESQLGPRYRIWLRNNSTADLTTPFNAVVVASNDDQLSADLPQAGVRIESVGAGETRAVDVRLPWEVYALSEAAGGESAFAKLHVMLDSHRDIAETSETNNGAVLDRQEVLPVDPAAFSTDVDAAVVGDAVSIAGEGFGPEPGQVLLFVQGAEWEAEIQGWYDLGVRIKVPNLPLTDVTEAELVVVRGDSAAANPLKLSLAPAGTELLPAP